MYSKFKSGTKKVLNKLGIMKAARRAAEGVKEENARIAQRMA